MQHSDFERPTESTRGGGTQAPTSDDLAAQISTALDQDDRVGAGSLLRDGLERFPENNRLLRLAARQRKHEERFTHVCSLLKETREALADDAFVRAAGAFREAVNLSRGFAGLEDAAFSLAVDEARDLGDRNWRIARSLLEDASRLNPKLVIPGHLLQGVQAAERKETIANVLAETALAKPDDLERARERLTRILVQYQDDSGLLNRLKSIESTIEAKRKWDERQKHLKKLTDLRDALQREEDPAEAGKYVRLSETLAVSYSAEPEFSSVIEDIRHQVISCEKAEVALKQDRIDDCLEECAWVLSRMRHHQLFLKLKEKAEKRELALVDEYSDAVSRIKELLSAGELVEAGRLCLAARAKLPQFVDLAELSKEIAQRKTEQDRHVQENGDSARRLVERGDRNLRARQYRATEQSFSNALKLLPGDKNLAGVVLGILHGYARSMARENADSAEEALSMAERILPGSAVPADLIEALRQRREHAKVEALRWSALNRIANFQGQTEFTKTPAQLVALRAEAGKYNFASSGHADVRAAASALLSRIDEKLTALDRRRKRQPAVLKGISIAAALLAVVGLADWISKYKPAAGPAQPPHVETTTINKPPTGPAPAAVAAAGSLLIRGAVPGARVFVNEKEYRVSSEPLKVALSANSYQVKSSRQGYKDFGPVTVVVAKSAETVLDVNLTPKPASVEIRGAEADTQIKLDGVLLAKAGRNKVWRKELAAGGHSIELSRSGYLPKTIARSLAPGETLVLAGRDVRLESSDARVLAAEQQDWNKLGSGASLSAIESFLATYPSGPHAPVARAKVKEFQWQSVDKSDLDSLRGFVAKYPASPFVNEAKREMQTVLLARETKAEEADWINSDRGNKAALEDFLKKYPKGRNAPAAANALAELERKTRAAETLSLEEGTWKKVNRRDEAALENYLRDSPAGRYRSQAEAALASLRVNQTSKNDTVAVLTVLSRFASAWSMKDVDSILAIQGNLNKHAVKAELSQIKELSMRISPASPPQIAGSQAVVLCRRQASQVFSDGTRKQIPESIVSYVLEKHDGNWTIEGTR
jgi:hypothetical protein